MKSVGAASFATVAVPAASVRAEAAVSSDVHHRYDEIELGAGPTLTNEQLGERLMLLAEKNDRINLRQIGASAGRKDPIWEVKAGSGDTSVHIINQIHGDEPYGTEALLSIFRRLVDEDSELVDSILNNLSLTILPRVNPDGAMHHGDLSGDGNDQRLGSRENQQEWDSSYSHETPYYYNDSLHASDVSGYDPNRDFNIRPDFISKFHDDPEQWNDDGELTMEYKGHTLETCGARLTPEVNAITRSFLEADPDYAKTIHSQNIPTDPDSGDPTILSVMASYGPSHAEKAPFRDEDAPLASYANPFIDEDTSTRSIRLNTLVTQALDETAGPWSTYETGTRFGYASLWGSYLDTLCPLTNAAGMLYELPGQSGQVGTRAYYKKVEAARVGVLESLAAIAENPSLSHVDEDDYFDIPLKGGQYEYDASRGYQGRGGAGTR
ncbi:M14 family zinc carboxypeptidase [Natronobacterium gregoryi]|nr:M14 family zinc carboxypeptidase [Natronobacterium gregoryi]